MGLCSRFLNFHCSFLCLHHLRLLLVWFLGNLNKWLVDWLFYIWNYLLRFMRNRFLFWQSNKLLEIFLWQSFITSCCISYIASASYIPVTVYNYLFSIKAWSLTFWTIFLWLECSLLFVLYILIHIINRITIDSFSMLILIIILINLQKLIKVLFWQSFSTSCCISNVASTSYIAITVYNYLFSIKAWSFAFWTVFLRLKASFLFVL